MKDILMIATGGTIASKPTQQGLAPLLSAEEIPRLRAGAWRDLPRGEPPAV